MKQKVFNVLLPVLLLLSIIGNVFLISQVNKSNNAGNPSTVLMLQQQVDDFAANLDKTQGLLADSESNLKKANEKIAELESKIAELSK